jgi:hypothetical protein
LAWLPSSLLILLYLLSTPLRAGQAASDFPLGERKKLGPQGTIAKVKVERKRKQQKRLEKCGFLRRACEKPAETQAVRTVQRRSRLKCGEIRVKVGDGFDAPEVILDSDVFVGSVGVFVRKAKPDQHAWNFECVMHLRDERNRAAFANEDSLFAKSFFEGALGDLENWRVERGYPRLAGAKHFELVLDGFRQEFANMIFHEFRDSVRILIGN